MVRIAFLGLNLYLCGVMKVLPYIILVIVAIVVIVCIALPAIKMHKMLDCRTQGEVYNPAEFGVESSVVRLQSADGIALTAYEVAVDNPKGVVICLGGIHSATVTNWYGHSRLFADNGFASLLLDLRSHGASEGWGIYAATREWQDVDAAVEYIKSQPRYSGVPVVAMGLSMGAATAVVATGRNSRIDALIALSAYSSWEFNFDRNVELVASKAVARILSPFVALVTRFRFGKMANISPINEITKLGSRPALLVQSVGDRTVPYANFEELTEAAPQAQKWVLEGDNHCIIDDFVHPQSDNDYCEKIVTFLNTLSNDKQ